MNKNKKNTKNKDEKKRWQNYTPKTCKIKTMINKSKDQKADT